MTTDQPAPVPPSHVPPEEHAKEGATAPRATDGTSDPRHYPEPEADAGMEPEREFAPGRPRWITVLVVVAIVLVIVILGVLHLTGVLGSGTN